MKNTLTQFCSLVEYSILCVDWFKSAKYGQSRRMHPHADNDHTKPSYQQNIKPYYNKI